MLEPLPDVGLGPGRPRGRTETRTHHARFRAGLCTPTIHGNTLSGGRATHAPCVEQTPAGDRVLLASHQSVFYCCEPHEVHDPKYLTEYLRSILSLEAKMARTVVYEATKTASGAARAPDGVASKIAKYVPVEMVTIATFFFSAFHVSGAPVWIFVGVGSALNVAYLASVARAATDTPQPKIQFYVLSAVAFALWAMATIDAVAKEAHLNGDTSSGQRAFILAFAVFSMPMLDTLLGARTPTDPPVA